MHHDLVERGVPKDRIVRFPHDADNTREEAEALRVLVLERKWHSVIIVTSNYHTRRARYIFEHVLPPSVKVRVASARDGNFEVEHWWENRKSFKAFTHELAGMLVAMWELRGGSPKAPVTTSFVQPGAVLGVYSPGKQPLSPPLILVYTG